MQGWTAALMVLVWSTVGRKEVNVYSKCSHFVRYDNKNRINSFIWNTIIIGPDLMLTYYKLIFKNFFYSLS